MLWLCLWFPDLPAEALAAAAGTVVVDSRGSRRWLVAQGGGWTAALNPGPGVGLDLGLARLRQPELVLLNRRPEAERSLLQSLGHRLHAYGQPVVAELRDPPEPGQLPRALLWLEAGASLRLFGGLRALAGQILAEYRALGHHLRLAVAPTRLAAAWLVQQPRPPAVSEWPALDAALADLPLACTHWPLSLQTTLQGLGLERLGALWRLPRSELVSRFGSTLLEDLDQARGRLAELHPALDLPARWQRRFELSGEVESLEGLLFPLRRLCGELEGWLRAHDRGLLQLDLQLLQAGGRRQAVSVSFVTACRERERLFEAVQQRLLREGLQAPARELRLQAGTLAAYTPVAGDLFARRGSEQALEAALERLQARLGPARVWRPGLRGDHRPERAQEARPLNAPAGPAVWPGRAARPCLLVDPPRPIAPPHLPPTAEAERIESGWWDGADCRRDYYRCPLDGGLAWVFHDRAADRWYLQGWWS
ncbi:MAG TPA: DNA polymerase Y family protein [Nevskiaceae bacterium]|nr:DNA polymerase Y family protein [Nevskiaceae bacterium]